MARPFRAEALASLVTIDRSSATRVLLDALAKVSAEDTQNADSLLDLLFEQNSATLRSQREILAQAAVDGESGVLVEGYDRPFSPITTIRSESLVSRR